MIYILMCNTSECNTVIEMRNDDYHYLTKGYGIIEIKVAPDLLQLIDYTVQWEPCDLPYFK